MAEDIVPALYERIENELRERNAGDKTIRLIFREVEGGTATLPRGHTYAERLGINLSDTLLNNLTADTLPGGRLWWNIADRTVRPLLMQNYEAVNALASQIQQGIDERENIGLATVRGVDPDARVRGIVEKATAEQELEMARKWLEEPIINCTESFFDDWNVANAEARYNAGMNPRIVRIAHPACCSWCAGLAGDYDYTELGRGTDVYKRHLFCRCTVTFENGSMRQDIWTRQTWNADEIAEREAHGLALDIRRG